MRTKLDDEYYSFTDYLNAVYMHGVAEASWGESSGPGHVTWVGGRHFLFTTDHGGAEHVKVPERFKSVEDAEKFVAEEWPEVIAWSIWTHDPARDGAGCTWCGRWAQVDADNLCEDCFNDVWSV